MDTKYVLRKRKEGLIQVDKQIIRWRKKRRKLLKELKELKYEEPKAVDLLAKSLFSNED